MGGQSLGTYEDSTFEINGENPSCPLLSSLVCQQSLILLDRQLQPPVSVVLQNSFFVSVSKFPYACKNTIHQTRNLLMCSQLKLSLLFFSRVASLVVMNYLRINSTVNGKHLSDILKMHLLHLTIELHHLAAQCCS